MTIIAISVAYEEKFKFYPVVASVGLGYVLMGKESIRGGEKNAYESTGGDETDGHHKGCYSQIDS